MLGSQAVGVGVASPSPNFLGVSNLLVLCSEPLCRSPTQPTQATLKLNGRLQCYLVLNTAPKESTAASSHALLSGARKGAAARYPFLARQTDYFTSPDPVDLRKAVRVLGEYGNETEGNSTEN
ncbi:hypothetical protein E2C01_046185 [Portunus trituberculatus]|uniref:Uncharacterized protein n=1 Tax=Portunus trituberculatus TaxID=210409 RepID=A0A5B7G440_PORTR|nr:hypothetical protein [Portunus trituberculatus]